MTNSIWDHGRHLVEHRPRLEPSSLRESGVRIQAIETWTLRQYVPTLSRELKELVIVRKRLTTGEMEPVAEDHSTAQRQVVRLTEAQLDRLVENYLAGKTVYELGRQFGIARQTVSEHLHRRGVPMRRRGLDEAQRPEVLRLRDEGWSLKRLGERFGVDASTVRNALLRDTTPLSTATG